MRSLVFAVFVFSTPFYCFAQAPGMLDALARSSSGDPSWLMQEASVNVARQEVEKIRAKSRLGVALNYRVQVPLQAVAGHRVFRRKQGSYVQALATKVWIDPGSRDRMESSQARLRGEQARLKSAMQHYLLRSTEAYLSVLRLQEEGTLADSEQAIFQKHLTIAKARLDAGVASVVEVAEAEQAWHAATARVAEAKRDISSARDQLGQMVGHPPEPSVSTLPADDLIVAYAALAPSGFAGEHPDIVAARSFLASSNFAVNEARKAARPRLTMKADYRYMKNRPLGKGRMGAFGIEFIVTVPFMDRRAGRAALSKAIASRDLALTTLALVESRVLARKEGSARRLATGRSSLQASASMLQSARDYLEGVQASVHYGTRNRSQWLAAESRVMEARLAYLRQRYGLVINSLQARLDAGELSTSDVHGLDKLLSMASSEPRKDQH